MEREIKNYRLNEFAQLIGVSIYTLQRWDREGILKAKRSPTNRRYYTYEQYLEFKGMKQGDDEIISSIIVALTEMSEGLSEEKKKKVVEIIKELEELKDNQEYQMFKIDKYNIKVEFNMDNGIYVPTCEAGTGKTWLCKTLKKYNSFGESVAAYDYQDYKNSIQLKDIVIPNRYKAIMIDRYDMFSEDIDESLFNLCRNNTIIIVDSKFGLNSIDYDVCKFQLEMNSIKVWG